MINLSNLKAKPYDEIVSEMIARADELRPAAEEFADIGEALIAIAKAKKEQ